MFAILGGVICPTRSSAGKHSICGAVLRSRAIAANHECTLVQKDLSLLERERQGRCEHKPACRTASFVASESTCNTGFAHYSELSILVLCFKFDDCSRGLSYFSLLDVMMRSNSNLSSGHAVCDRG